MIANWLFTASAASLWAFCLSAGLLGLGLLRGTARWFVVFVACELVLFGWLRHALEAKPVVIAGGQTNPLGVSRFVPVSLDAPSGWSTAPEMVEPLPPDEPTLTAALELSSVAMPLDVTPFEDSGPATPAFSIDELLPPESPSAPRFGTPLGEPVAPGLPGLDGVAPLPPALLTETEFFPAVSGGRIVFVIDRSGSMLTNRRLDRVNAEVQQIIAQSPPGLEFAVLFFNDRFQWLGGGDRPPLVKQSPETVEQTIKAMNRIEPDGGTEPLPALFAALELGPDEVFFLTDGDFRYSAADAQALAERNTNKARIHGTLICEKTLPPNKHVATIADQHRGVFTLKRED